jgi:glycosyltransferase involved in cell wall biosynthesis
VDRTTRVLWVTENYPPDQGGMAQSCDRIVHGLRAAGVGIDVAHLTRRDRARGRDRSGELYRPTREPGGCLFTVPLAGSPEHVMRCLWTQLTARGATYSQVVAFGGTYPLLSGPVYAAWAGAPLITLLRGNDLDTGVFSVRRQPVVLEALRSSRRICVVASSTRDLVSALVPGATVVWIANGIDLDDWVVLPSERRQAAIWRTRHVPPGRLALGLVGHLKDKKGVRFLLDALTGSGYRDRFHLVLAGEVEDGLATWLAGHRDSVSHTLLPFRDRLGLPAVYASCDVVALPSFYDGMPNVALEAAALGIPLLASDAGGLADLVDDRNGFRFAAGDLHGCRAALHRLVETSPARLAELGAAGAARVAQRFTPKAETEAYLEVLRSTAGPG